jgi:hypothetical protein
MPLPLVGTSSRHDVLAAATATPTVAASDRSKDTTRRASTLAARDAAGCRWTTRAPERYGCSRKALSSRQRTDVYASVSDDAAVRRLPKVHACEWRTGRDARTGVR